MTATTTDTPGVDNFDWLEAIDAHPETTREQYLTAWLILGAVNDGTLTEEQVDKATFGLHLLGFLWPIDISADGRTYTYELRIPQPR